jgi:hypothetical protein
MGRMSFHLALVLVMAAFVFVGFGLTYIGPHAVGTRPPDPPIVHLHGAVFFSWMLLLIAQAALVNVKKVALHRSLGMFGIAVGTLVVVMGVFITVVGASGVNMVGDTPAVFYLSVVAPPSFAVLFVMAIRAVKRVAVHRSLILIATIAILMPGINRVYMAGLGAQHVPFVATYLTMDVLLAAVLWKEWKVLGAVSRATGIGSAIVVVPQLLIFAVSSQPWWSQFIYWLGSLAVYR